MKWKLSQSNRQLQQYHSSIIIVYENIEMHIQNKTHNV